MNDNSNLTTASKRKRGAGIVAPVLITALGVGQLLSNQGVIPGVAWPWILSLAVVGVLLVVIDGVNKLSFVVAPTLVTASLMSFLRQTAQISLETEIPVLLIIVGVTWTASRLLPWPLPPWILTAKERV